MGTARHRGAAGGRDADPVAPHMRAWQRRRVTVSGRELAVWPRAPSVQRTGDASIYTVVFDDTAQYHTRLTEAILAREHDARYGLSLFRGACGVKVHHVDRWDVPEAALVHQRALAFYSAVSAVSSPVCDMSWANVYRHGDYCLPHSHTRTEASVVYHLADGDADADNPLGGRLCFADPRIAFCCDAESGRVTRSLMPDMVPGMMVIFPSQAVHFVNPYTGSAPRITLSWNLSPAAIPGSPNPELDRRRGELQPQ